MKGSTNSHSAFTIQRLINSYQSIFFNLPISQKCLVALAVPVALQAIIIGFLCSGLDADEFAVQAGWERDRSNLARQVVFKSISSILIADECISLKRPFDRTVDTNVRYIDYLVKHPDFPTDSSSNESQILQAVRTKMVLLGELLARAKGDLEHRGNILGDNIIYQRIALEMNNVEADIQSRLLTLMDNRLKKVVSENPEQANNRHLIFAAIIAISLLNLIALLFVGHLFSRHIFLRLRRLSDTCIQFQRGQTLDQPVLYADEIGTLESSLHQMAFSLNEAFRTQKALFDNATDLLCYVDDTSLCFTAVNGAASALLNCDPQCLIGESVASVILPEDASMATQSLRRLVEARAKPPFENCAVKGEPFDVRLRSLGGNILNTHWSAQYIPSAKRIFCSVNDVTEKIKAQRLRKEIAQMVNHDLRSPLNAIRVIYSILERSANLNEQGTRNLALAMSNTDRMLVLVNELLDIEKLEAGQLTINCRKLNLRDVLLISVNSVEAIARTKRLSISVDCGDIMLEADEHRLIQVLVNFLSNAIKYSPQGGEITVNAVELENLVRVNVSDLGRGIPLNARKSIFARFSQVETSDATVRGGTGLGLAICKALIELHNGEVGVDSTVGVGSTFYFQIPKASSDDENSQKFN